MSLPILRMAAAMTLANVLASNPSPASSPSLVLTPEEQAWLQAHPVIRVGYDPNWPPFCFTNAQGKFEGLDRDAISIIQQLLGIRLEIKSHSTWTEALQAGQNRNVDLLCSIGETPDRREYFQFTQPYLYLPHVFISKNHPPNILSIAELAHKTVALPKEYTITHGFNGYYPKTKIKLFDTESQCFEALNNGTVDLTVSQIAAATHQIRSHNYWDLHFAGVYPEPVFFRYAVRKDWPELVSILNKAIAHFDIDQRQALYNKWVNDNIPQVFPWRNVISIALGLLLLLILLKVFLFYRNRLLSHQLRLREELLEKIEKQSRELATVSAAKTQLLRTIAHDLRNPLSNILLNLGIHDSASSPQPFLSDIKAQTHAMALLLDNTLTAQAIEDGAALYPIIPIDIAALTRHVAKNYTPTATQKNLRLEIDTSTCPSTFPLNETAWRQILQNLLTNALKFSNPDGRISLLLALQADTLLFTIQDNGPGLSPEDPKKLFTLYGKGSASPTRGEESRGIGLTVVRELVTRLGGRITCENASPGALFSIRFPITKSA